MKKSNMQNKQSMKKKLIEQNTKTSGSFKFKLFCFLLFSVFVIPLAFLGVMVIISEINLNIHPQSIYWTVPISTVIKDFIEMFVIFLLINFPLPKYTKKQKIICIIIAFLDALALYGSARQ